MKPANETQRIAAKWGPAAMAGFQGVPDLLLKNQSRLDLTATEMLVLLNITMHWWYPDQRPFPRSTIIAKRMGVETRTVQRAISRLQELKLLQKVKEISDGEEREVCDVSGLVAALSAFAKDDPDYLHRQAKYGGAANEAA